MLQKYYGDDLLHLCVTYKPYYADNTKTLKMSFHDKLREVCATNEFNTVIR